MREEAARGRTADQLKEKAAKEAARAEKRAAVNLQARVNAALHIERAPTPLLGLESLLTGTNTPFEGSRMSAESAILGYKNAFLGRFRRDLGVNEKTFASRQLELEWVTELAELNAKQGGKPGVTGSKPALEIAEAIKKMQDTARETINRHGADVGQLDRYIARTEHSSERLEAMGREGWKKLINETADLVKTFGAGREAEYDELLDTMYGRLRLGRFYDFEVEEDRFIAPSQNVAKAVSQSRVIQFKDAAGWYRYAQEAGDTPVTDRILSAANKAARDSGLMSVLGTNPKDTFGRIFGRVLEATTDRKEQKQLEGAENRLNTWLSIMTGDANKITNKGAALATQNWLTLQRVAKLGLLPFSQIADLSTIVSELKYQGVDIPARLMGPMAGYFKGKGSQQREVARLLGGAIDGWMSEISAHMDMFDAQLGGGPVTGFLANTQNFMFKWSGASAMTNRAREAGLYLMAGHWGQKRGVAFDKLNVAERRIMAAYDIGKPEWTALNAGEWANIQGDVFLTPHVVESIPSAALDKWKLSTGKIHADDATARHELATRLWRYYSDREKYAVLDIGVRERFVMTRGMAADTSVGIAFRVIGQFKSFMVAQIGRTWGREIYGGQGKLGAVSGLVQFAVAATALGVVGEMMRQIAKGQDPFFSFGEDPAGYLGKGAVRGGAGAILGDFFLSEYTRHGQRATGYAAGPTGDIVDTLLAMKSQIAAGENVAPTALNLAKSNLPMQNFIWTKAAMDALIWSELMEMVNPGYERRVARNQRKQGIRPLSEMLNR